MGISVIIGGVEGFGNQVKFTKLMTLVGVLLIVEGLRYFPEKNCHKQRGSQLAASKLADVGPPSHTTII